MNFPPDRFEHALEAYAYFHGRECSPMDVTRFLEHDTRLSPRDHLLAIKVDGHTLRFVGVVTEGCTIVDMTDGPPTWALNKMQGQCDARTRARRSDAVLDLEGLDIPRESKYQQG